METATRLSTMNADNFALERTRFARRSPRRYADGGGEDVRTSRTSCGGSAGRGSTLWLAKSRRWVVLLPVLSTMENGRVVGETDEEAFRKQRSGADSGCSTTRGPRPCSAAFACAWPLCSQGGLMMAEITPDPIMRIALGFMAAKHLFIASGIGLFDALAGGPAELDELAAKLAIPRRTLRISADAMVSLGLLEREGNRYRNSAVAAAFLSGALGHDLRPMLRFFDRIVYGLWMNLETAVRGGEGQRQFHRFSDEQQQIFSAGVEAFTAGTAAALAANYD